MPFSSDYSDFDDDDAYDDYEWKSLLPQEKAEVAVRGRAFSIIEQQVNSETRLNMARAFCCSKKETVVNG
ncbi:MAG: hypothetical protein ABWY25_07290 [Paenisporosarcina sp.]